MTKETKEQQDKIASYEGIIKDLKKQLELKTKELEKVLGDIKRKDKLHEDRIN